jgi:hypothetical protein
MNRASDFAHDIGDTMKAAVFHGPNQPLTIETLEIDKPGPREVLIRTAVAGLCHSDLHFIDGKYPWPAPRSSGTNPPASSRRWATRSPT